MKLIFYLYVMSTSKQNEQALLGQQVQSNFLKKITLADMHYKINHLFLNDIQQKLDQDSMYRIISDSLEAGCSKMVRKCYYGFDESIGYFAASEEDDGKINSTGFVYLPVDCNKSIEYIINCINGVFKVKSNDEPLPDGCLCVIVTKNGVIG